MASSIFVIRFVGTSLSNTGKKFKPTLLFGLVVAGHFTQMSTYKTGKQKRSSELVFLFDDCGGGGISGSSNLAISVWILCITSAVGVALPLLPYHKVDTNRVPIGFKGRQSTFHAFVVSIMFAFSGAVSALFVHEKRPEIAKLCQYCSSLSILSAAALLIYAMFS